MVNQRQIPSVALIIIAAFVGLHQMGLIIGHVFDPPKTELGLLSEIYTLIVGIFVLSLFAIGLYSYTQEKIYLPVSVLTIVVSGIGVYISINDF